MFLETQMTDNRPDPTDQITLAEAARLSGLALRTLQTQRRNGRIAAHKLGRDWVLTRGELHRYLAARRRARPKALAPSYVTPEGMEEIR